MYPHFKINTNFKVGGILQLPSDSVVQRETQYHMCWKQKHFNQGPYVFLQRNKIKHWQNKDGFSLPLSKTKVRKPMSLQLLHVTFDTKLAVEQLEGFFSSTLALLISLSKASPQKSRFTVLKVTTEQFLKACYSQFHPPPLHLDQVLPSGGFLFWLFQTTSNLDRLGTLDTSVMTRKRLSTLS